VKSRESLFNSTKQDWQQFSATHHTENMDASASEDYEYDYGSDEDDYPVDDDDMSWDATGDNPNAPPVAMMAFSPKGTCHDAVW
jgi:hypothetical protein